MRTLTLLICFVAVTAAAIAQPANPAVPNAATTSASSKWIIAPVFGDRQSLTASDIITDGKIDTSLSAGYTFYGRIWPSTRMIGAPRIHITGADSAKIGVFRRKVSYTASKVAYGPWVAIGDSVTIKKPRTGIDTLIAVDVDSLSSTTFLDEESGYFQHKYAVTPLNAANGNAILLRPKNTVGNAKTFSTWMGEVTITIRKEGGN